MSQDRAEQEDGIITRVGLRLGRQLARKRASLALLFLLVIAVGGRASATPPDGTCFALAPSVGPDQPPANVRCVGAPAGYEEAALWLRLPLPAIARAEPIAVVVGTTRFERMAALFAYADGSTKVEEVRRGAFGARWHVGGQIAFESGRARLHAAWLRLDGLQSYDLLRIRLVPAAALPRHSEICATLVGGALALLALAAFVNLGLAIFIRQSFFLWHGLWAALVLCWGLVWSQCALLLLPGIAGTAASKTATILSCLAILFASLTAADVLAEIVPRPIRRAIAGGGIGVVALGAVADLPGADLRLLGIALATLTLALLAAVGAGLAVAWRRGHVPARDHAIAWAIPMLVLAATQLFDFDTRLFGGGAQIAVLFASAFQTIGLSALATRRLGRLRVERDAALAGNARLADLAERDVLTGLLNRRGFVRRCDDGFGRLRDAPFGLLLIDVDRFKRINDQFGHETGDAVLVSLGQRLRRLEQQYLCLAGRLGGEEFVVGISGLPAYALRQFADHVRDVLGAGGDLAPGAPSVTVSIGVAEGSGSGPFQLLYGPADRALYEAKAAGRNRVVFTADPLPDPDQQLRLALE